MKRNWSLWSAAIVATLASIVLLLTWPATQPPESESHVARSEQFEAGRIDAWIRDFQSGREVRFVQEDPSTGRRRHLLTLEGQLPLPVGAEREKLKRMLDRLKDSRWNRLERAYDASGKANRTLKDEYELARHVVQYESAMAILACIEKNLYYVTTDPDSVPRLPGTEFLVSPCTVEGQSANAVFILADEAFPGLASAKEYRDLVLREMAVDFVAKFNMMELAARHRILSAYNADSEGLSRSERELLAEIHSYMSYGLVEMGRESSILHVTTPK